MIKMKALRSFHGEEGKVRRGREFTAVGEYRARDLENHGLAYRLNVQPQPRQASPEDDVGVAPSNKAAETGPLASAGGETGAEAPAPSSPPDRPQRRRRSRASKEGADLLS